MFTDRTKIYIQSGKGGDGHVSFRRELYVPNGGPDGGNGGRGGDVIFVVDEGLNTLSDFRYNKKYAAENGYEGGKRRSTGRDGKNLVLKVPEGTVVYDDETGKLIADMSGDNRECIILKGGRGGRGNMNFATSVMQAPQYAQPGQEARKLYVRLELKVIADVGLVGFPNAGKSSFLAACTRARPKIADYPFTTLNPNLGVAYPSDDESFVIADIPGLIEGASQGVGLGYEFLRHIERTRMLIHMVDISGIEERNPVTAIEQINEELKNYDDSLINKPQVIACNKTDLLLKEDVDEITGKISKSFPDTKVFAISTATGDGIKQLVDHVKQELDKLPKGKVTFTPETDIDSLFDMPEAPITTRQDSKDSHLFYVEGERVEKMLGYTNLESEKGFLFFQEFMEKNGIIKKLKALGMTEGDTVKVGEYLDFEYFDGQDEIALGEEDDQ